jgi:hypothetical protein
MRRRILLVALATLLLLALVAPVAALAAGTDAYSGLGTALRSSYGAKLGQNNVLAPNSMGARIGQATVIKKSSMGVKLGQITLLPKKTYGAKLAVPSGTKSAISNLNTFSNPHSDSYAYAY